MKTLLKDQRSGIFVSLLFNVLAAILFIAKSEILKIQTQEIIGKDFSNVFWYCLFLLVLTFAMDYFIYLFQVSSNKVKKQGMLQYRKRVIDNLYQTKHKIDDDFYISSLNTDALQVEKAFDMYFLKYDVLIFIVFSFIGLCLLHWLIAVGTIVIFGLTYLIPKFLKKKAIKNEEDRATNNKEYLKTTTNFLQGFDEFDMHNKKDILSELSYESSFDFETKRQKINNVDTFISFIGDLSHAISTVLLSIWTLYIVYLGLVDAGVILSTGILATMLFGNLSAYIEQVVKIEGIDEIVLSKTLDGSVPMKHDIKVKDFDLSVSDLSFSYGEKSVLDAFSYVFKMNHKYLLIGDSGSGKSTLLNLLDKSLEPNSGSIKLGTYDYKDISELDVREYIGYVMQDVYIFNGTLKENIDLFGEYSDSDVLKAMKDSRVDEFTNDLNFMIEDNGDNLSGGQKQRIAIARVLLQNQPILLFDEATRSLDQTLNQEVVDIVTKLNKTVIFVAHNYDEGMKDQFDAVVEFGGNAL